MAGEIDKETISRLATESIAEVPFKLLLMPLAGSVADIVAMPGTRVRTSPFEEVWFDTTATTVSELVQSTIVVTSAVEPLSYVPSAMKDVIAPAGTDVDVGMMLMLVRLASDTRTCADSFVASLLILDAVSRAEIEAMPRLFAVVRRGEW